MASLVERVLARADKVIHEAFRMPHSGSNTPSGGMQWTYWSSWGPKMVIIGVDGRVRRLANAFSVVHEYDKDRKLLSRKLECRNLQSGERLILGHRRSYIAYERYGSAKMPSSGGFDN